MCEARFAPYEHRKARGDRTNASVPAGTLVPAGEREFAECATISKSVAKKADRRRIGGGRWAPPRLKERILSRQLILLRYLLRWEMYPQ